LFYISVCKLEFYKAVLPESPATVDLIGNLKTYFMELFFEKKDKDKEKDTNKGEEATSSSPNNFADS
jgi:hypothetical protein